jgi:hypothetical protein
MKYPPGSFSKNFAWHGTGLRKLHAAISKGFGGKLSPVERQKWRTDCAVPDRSLQLIPINFFMHNAHGRMSVDELVFQAVAKPHSIHFDRLGLFAFHLNHVGQPPQGPDRPAMWASEFVRKRLWKGGVWRADSLDDETLDNFIADRMDAQKNVRIKCRNNYRHLFQLFNILTQDLTIGFRRRCFYHGIDRSLIMVRRPTSN